MWAIQPGAAAARRDSSAAPSSLLTGLVAYWTLDEASGSRADSVGANTLTDNNTVTQATGKVGSAAQFTAANSEYLSSADNAALSTGDIDFELSAWCYFDTLPAAGCGIVAKWTASGNQREYCLDFNGTNRLRFYVSANGSTVPDIATANTFGAPSTATWYFVLAYHDSVNNLLGISVNNGAFDTVAHTTGVFDGTGVFYIGTREGTDERMNGRIDEVGFWKRLLTAAERTALYNSGNGRTYPFAGT